MSVALENSGEARVSPRSGRCPDARVAPMSSHDVDAVVCLHQQVFPEYFLSSLGCRFLRHYYAEFLGRDDAFGFVANVDGRTVGFVVGVLDAAAFYRRFYKRRFASLLLILGSGVIRSARLRLQVLKRLRHVRFAMGSLVGEQAGALVFQNISETPTRLLALGVAPDARGHGVAEMLIDELNAVLNRVGATTVGLSVRAENLRAIAFYLRTGWVREQVGGSSLYFIRATTAVRPSAWPPQLQELSRIRHEYERRGRDNRLVGLYDSLDAGQLFLAQGRERALLDVLRTEGFTSLDTVRLLDVGCGTGSDLAKFHAYGMGRSSLVGLDLLADRVVAARLRYPYLQLLQGEGSHLPFASGTFDILLQSTVFSSVLDPELRESIAADMLRVLKPNGLIIWYDFWLNPTNSATRGLRAWEIRKLFPDCRIRLRTVTLAPPIARRVARWAWFGAQALETLPFLRTHLCAAIRKPVIRNA
jgi:ribosomal protein S18 acetylase RimI-like enzyme/ubiquinone/menaquinone biosynthesis C-methylase UbiE